MTLREDLYAWLAEMPGWQRDLVRRLTRTTHLEGEELEDVRRIIYAAHGVLASGGETPETRPITLDELPGPSGSGEVTRLVRIGKLRGVGMVAGDQELVFAEDGLTVIYGPNAAGKSTYVVALKRVCRAVDCDSGIRGNVFADAIEQPTATVEYLRGTERRAQQLDLNAPAATGLEVLSVFDARCAELYLDARNAVAYVPSSLVVLARLAAAQDALRHDVDAEISRLERRRPTFPELQPGTAAYQRVADLSAATKLDELRAFAQLEDSETARLAQLRAALATAAARNARPDAEAASQEAARARSALEKLRILNTRVTNDAATQLRNKAAEFEAARAALTAASEQFATLARPGIGGDPWRRMWQATREFVAATGGTFPPSRGESCPLCIQRLTDDAAQRLRHFEQHIQSALQTQANAAENALELALEQLDAADVPELDDVFSNDVAAREPELARVVRAVRDAIEQRILALRADPLHPTLAPLPAIPIATVDDWASRREQHATMLLSAADPEGERKLAAEVAELDGRENLRARLDSIAEWVATMGRIAALRRAHGALATNRITTKQRELSTRAVTGALASALASELSQLRCDHLPLDLEPYTAVGETQVALRLAGARGTPRVSEILSEGEQRAVSLAFFFAEIGLAEHAGGVIVDDPVSSLDDERRSYIAHRLVGEAQQRQVIVLTHDLPFMLDLLEQAEKAGLTPKLQGIWRLGGSVGRVDQKPPFAAMNFKQRVGELEQRVAQWDTNAPPVNADEAWHRVCDLYADMRTSWERAVEERLFKGVVQRFQRQVKTLKLPTVVVNSDLVHAIADGITRCSYFVHDAPLGTRTSLPGRAELAADVEKLRNFERATRLSS